MKEGDPDIHSLMIWAALEEAEISEFDIHDAVPEHDGARSSTAAYSAKGGVKRSSSVKLSGGCQTFDTYDA